MAAPTSLLLLRRCRRRLTAEVLRGVDAAASHVARRLRKRAQRPGPIDDAAGGMRSNDARWSNAALDPLLESRQHVEGVRAGTVALAVVHPGRHEQLQELVASLPPARRFDDLVVVGDGRSRTEAR